VKLRLFREPVRVLFHLSEGYTRVLPERFEGIGMTDGSIGYDIPTKAIPAHLRVLGSRFLLIGQYVTPEEQDSWEDIRVALRSLQIQEL
jgi:hypothetical protein